MRISFRIFFCASSVSARPLTLRLFDFKASRPLTLNFLKKGFSSDLTECFPLSYNIGLTLKNLKERNKMIKKTLFAAAAILTLSAAAAHAAPCTDDQEATAGMLAAGIGKTAVSKVVAVTGKQMVNIEACEFRAGSYQVDYKYNFLAADGLYWVELSAKFGADGSGATTKVNRSSPNMAAAEAKAGVKLAAN